MHRAKQGKGECLQHNIGWAARLGDHWAWGSEEPRLDKYGHQVLFGQVKKPLDLHFLINSWDKFMLLQSQKIRNCFYFPGWSPLYTKFMEMPTSFCKIPVNFMIRKVFSLIGILLMIESTNCQILILGKILQLILVWAAVWKANKIVSAVCQPHSNSQRWCLLWFFVMIQDWIKVSVLNFLRDSKFV